MTDEIDDAGYELAERFGDAINEGDYTGLDVLKAATFILGSVVSEEPRDLRTYASRLQDILRHIDASRRAHLRDAGIEAEELDIEELPQTH